jgi:hypothetical protein
VTTDIQNQPPRWCAFSIYDEAWAHAHATNELESLASSIETLTADSANPDPVVAHLAGERLRAYQSVYGSRLAALRVENGTATPRDRDRQAWIKLVRTVKERVSIVDVLQLGGIRVTWHGCEGHSRCPFCGGTDRFVIWPGPPERAWCRRCHDRHERMDVIAVTQSLIPDCEGFHAAARFLANYAQVAEGGA